MFGLSKGKGPSRAFTHAQECKILKADPLVEIPWQEVETGLWIAECVCGKEYQRETPGDHRVRLDPRDPSTFRHGRACEHQDVTDAALLKAILRVHDGDGYWWVECGTCDYGWQVPYYAAESVG
jgi:hypothetical protein